MSNRAKPRDTIASNATLEAFNNLKHKDAILEMFSALFDSWMNDQDKSTLISNILEAEGKSPESFDAEIEKGIQNGYTVEQQIDLVKRVVGRAR